MSSSIFGKSAGRDKEFLEKSLPQNRIILCAGTAVAVIVELMNIFRVLFLTDTKLSTLNNQIYFGFYLTYFIIAILFLMLEFFVRMAPASRHRLYMISASAMATMGGISEKQVALIFFYPQVYLLCFSLRAFF